MDDRIELSSYGQQRSGEQLIGESTAGRLWLGLAAAALAAEGAPEMHTDPRAIAEALNHQMADGDRAKKVVSYLLGLSRELRLSHGAEAAVLKERLSSLLNHIKEDTLKGRLTSMSVRFCFLAGRFDVIGDRLFNRFVEHGVWISPLVQAAAAGCCERASFAALPGFLPPSFFQRLQHQRRPDPSSRRARSS